MAATQQALPISPYISLYLPISPCISLYLPVPPQARTAAAWRALGSRARCTARAAPTWLGLGLALALGLGSGSGLASPNPDPNPNQVRAEIAETRLAQTEAEAQQAVGRRDVATGALALAAFGGVGFLALSQEPGAAPSAAGVAR